MMLITLCFSLVLAVSIQASFPAVDYYWPMTQTNMSVMNDVEIYSVPAELHFVSFTRVRRLGWAVSLHNLMQWIDVDAGVVKDCLAFQFSSCNDEQALSLAFWIRMRGGKRIIATGSYTNSTSGPGILVEYDAKNEILKVDMASTERHWSVQILLRKNSWCHVAISWTFNDGLIVVLDGRVNEAESFVKDKKGQVKTIKGKPYTKMITIGRPRNISDERNYGNFDMSHFVVYFRDLTSMEIRALPYIPLKSGNEKDLECCYAKKNDECIKNPCHSSECINVEDKYHNCICTEVQHSKCKEYPTTIPPTIPVKCNKFISQNKDDILGCGNILGTSLCGNNACYYGICEPTNELKQCRCDANCTKLGVHPVCGYNSKHKLYSTYENLCIMKKASCLRKEVIRLHSIGECVSPVENATHYWPMEKINKYNVADDVKGGAPSTLHNGVLRIKHNQLKYALHLDGESNWIDIKNLENRCVSNLQCVNGLSVGFWMQFKGGDYIFTSGGFAAGIPSPPGFRLQRDKKTKFFKLEVATIERKWQLYIYDFPKQWFYFSFSWHPVIGLKLYINGKLELEQPSGVVQESTRQRRKGSVITNNNKMIIGRHDGNREFLKYGQLNLAHLAIWTKALSPSEISIAYSSHVTEDNAAILCCYKIKGSKAYRGTCGKNLHPEEWKRIKNASCICTDIDLIELEKNCNAPQTSSAGECLNRNHYCKQLAVDQKGFCKNNKQKARQACQATCNMCESSFLASVGPQQHFSQETIIIALLACIGGLILLLGFTVYFWKIYRTRYHGHFVPPIKTVSLLDVSDYEDEKWPNKYIDNAAFYIKDVPPKKRALPLIPARNTLSGHRYQPPEFD